MGKIGGLVYEYSTKTSSTGLLSPPRTGYDGQLDDQTGLGSGLGLGSPLSHRNGQPQYKGLFNELVSEGVSVCVYRICSVVI